MTSNVNFSLEIPAKEQGSAPDGLCFIDSDLYYTTINEPLAALNGLPVEAHIGRRPSEVLGDFGHYLESLCQNVLDTGKAVVNIKADMPDGDRSWLMSFYLVSDRKGKVLGVSAIVKEATEHNRAERAVRESRAKLQAALESMTDAVFISDKDGNYIEFNDAFAKFYKFRSKKETAKTFAEYPRILEATMADGTLAPPDMWAVPRALRGEAVTNAEYTLRRKDTGETWVGYYSFAPIHDATGAIIGSVVVARDITYRKRIEEDLRRTSDLLRAIIKYSPDIIFAKDCQCRLVHASDSLLRLLDKKPEEVLGKTDAEIYADPKVGEAIMENDRIVRETGLPLVVEERAELPDGTFRTFRSTKVPWLSEDGSLLGTFGIAVDINELKAKEQELSKAREDAERANNAKSLFLAAASHDLRQPLQALNLYFDVLAERLPPKDAPLMKPIRSCLDSLNELLTDLLDLSKLDAGVVAPNISDFPLADILQKIATAYAPQAEAKGIRIRVGSSKFWVRTDPVLLERIVGNLVANAVRYTEHGGVVIGCRRRDGKTWVEVTDTGIGIPKNKQSEIFEEFRQLGNDARNREKGSGLGLAIVKKTVDVLGLEIKVMSKLRQGSTFALAIPLGEPADNLVPHAACENRSLRIAVLEDAVDVREALTLALDQCGHSVVAAASSAELMTRLGDLAPQVILADYRLGDETGLDGIVLVRKAFGNEIPAIILTGDTDPEVVRGIAAHDIQLKHKPLKFDALQECLKKLASKTRQ